MNAALPPPRPSLNRATAVTQAGNQVNNGRFLKKMSFFFAIQGKMTTFAVAYRE